MIRLVVRGYHTYLNEVQTSKGYTWYFVRHKKVYPRYQYFVSYEKSNVQASARYYRLRYDYSSITAVVI